VKVVSEKSIKKVAFHSDVIGKDEEGIFRLDKWCLYDKTYAIKRNTDILDKENIKTFDELMKMRILFNHHLFGSRHCFLLF
jgi:hypothetical protein